ncbi:hypothetical protein CTA2_5481 [Colletotrichum tanaceti]|uniref:Uncharacterized protein n=1 Tax=Colletotrichum tanaceti TaxID=1306861 RepID=A0A4V6Y9F7_9PEZI|nr:hypothetical protein CTA2_5481 [Colletotrichum tanaceti]TKW53506.1 hypothetical protein CTA1_12385 [Colletotrichum tanaceti]
MFTRLDALPRASAIFLQRLASTPPRALALWDGAFLLMIIFSRYSKQKVYCHSKPGHDSTIDNTRAGNNSTTIENKKQKTKKTTEKMSLNLASPFSPLPSYLIGTGLTFVGLLGFVRPFAVYDAFGLARPGPAEPRTFSHAKSVRDLATGALFVFLETYQEGSGNEDAVTALLAVTACVGFADWWIVGAAGREEEGEWDGSKGLVHLGCGVLLGAFALWRYLY